MFLVSKSEEFSDKIAVIILLPSLDEEEIDKLNPNYALYKATSAHNLPVMCQAISLGADKNWENPESLNRTPLHQAILAVNIHNAHLNYSS